MNKVVSGIDSSTGRASDLGSKGPEFDSRMEHKILIIFSLYLILYEFDMKSFKLIRNINYNILNYILNFVCIFTVLCGVEVRALDCGSQHSGFESP